jgi:hypothetical protein
MQATNPAAIPPYPMRVEGHLELPSRWSDATELAVTGMSVSERRAQRAGATNGDGLRVTTSAADLTPTSAWSRRVRSIGGLIQAAFAAFWLVRGSAVIGGGVAGALIAVFGVTVVGVYVYGIRASAGSAPRPQGQEAKRIERAVTVATVVQLVASFALPVVVIAAGHSDWVLPSIAITIGPLLLWLDSRVHIARYRPVGWALIAGPVILVAVMSGTPLVATTGIAAGLLLLGIAVAGFHDLMGVRGEAAHANPIEVVVPASAGAQR